ncbi:MAG TPA: bifunctional ADP-dependent NAD(P)H-hydrate dehydratase/NAD(P)H-hydrate epimerase [Saprospirales bacterium]|nr:bifunctional ADP-dependent NAD(P)H-hydrate dehydratase/NAD(P)H-hydrate epimerase [Saprospirales bacterium]
MKIYSAAQTRAWDAFTMDREPITSFELMNRAVQVLSDWFIHTYPSRIRPVLILCGTGNNGGDGVALARHLCWEDYDAKVVVCDFNGKHSEDFDRQMALLPSNGQVQIEIWHNAADFSPMPANVLVIDALFGSGLNRVLEGVWADLVMKINALPNEVLSIDLPSGLLADQHTPGHAVVHADRTFSFERPKKAFFFAENAERVGEWTVRSIGLSPAYEKEADSKEHCLTLVEASSWVKPRAKFAHKGTFGHALLIAGSFGKMGAAVLCARACLRSGTGLLSVHSPRCGNLVLQTAVPEAMYSPDKRAKYWSAIPDLDAYAAIGIGPGIDRHPETILALQGLIQSCKSPVVLDADALNILSENPDWWVFIPKRVVLTPHVKEFERLFGVSTNDFQRHELQRAKAVEHQVTIVLKGAHTCIALPDGSCWFNTTGNAGMATGGSGDVLTGMITGLLAQGYAPEEAALLGVYLHGLAGDFAANRYGETGMIAGDLIKCIPEAWNKLKSRHEDLPETA